MKQESQYKLGVAVRATAAIGGGYALAALSTAVLALLLPMAKADAVLTATMLSFAIYACAVIWVFAAKTAWRAWAGLAAPATMLGLLLLALRGGA